MPTVVEAVSKHTNYYQQQLPYSLKKSNGSRFNHKQNKIPTKSRRESPANNTTSSERERARVRNVHAAIKSLCGQYTTTESNKKDKQNM